LHPGSLGAPRWSRRVSWGSLLGGFGWLCDLLGALLACLWILWAPFWCLLGSLLIIMCLLGALCISRVLLGPSFEILALLSAPPCVFLAFRGYLSQYVPPSSVVCPGWPQHVSVLNPSVSLKRDSKMQLE